LMLRQRLKDAGQLAIVQLEEPGLETGGILDAADQAHTADVLSRPYRVLQAISLFLRGLLSVQPSTGRHELRHRRAETGAVTHFP
jgi:hypothetical protein